MSKTCHLSGPRCTSVPQRVSSKLSWTLLGWIMRTWQSESQPKFAVVVGNFARQCSWLGSVFELGKRKRETPALSIRNEGRFIWSDGDLSMAGLGSYDTRDETRQRRTANVSWGGKFECTRRARVRVRVRVLRHTLLCVLRSSFSFDLGWAGLRAVERIDFRDGRMVCCQV